MSNEKAIGVIQYLDQQGFKEGMIPNYQDVVNLVRDYDGGENASLKERVNMSTEQLLKLLFDEGLLKIDFDQDLNPIQDTFDKWMDDYGDGFLHDLTNNQQSDE